MKSGKKKKKERNERFFHGVVDNPVSPHCDSNLARLRCGGLNYYQRGRIVPTKLYSCISFLNYYWIISQKVHTFSIYLMTAIYKSVGFDSRRVMPPCLKIIHTFELPEYVNRLVSLYLIFLEEDLLSFIRCSKIWNSDSTQNRESGNQTVSLLSFQLNSSDLPKHTACPFI